MATLANNQPDTVDTASRLEVLLTEYRELKAEQRARIESRDALIYTSLAVAAAVVTGVTQTRIALLLLTLPPAGVLLGWTYLAKDRMVSAIGRYLRTDLRGQLEGLAGGAVLGWEFDNADDARRGQRKRIQAAVDLGTFCLPGLAAIAACLAMASTPLTIAIAAAEAAAVAVLAWQILVYADGIRRADAVEPEAAAAS